MKRVYIDIKEDGLSTYFVDPWIKERERRWSLDREIPLNESEKITGRHRPSIFFG